MGLDDPRTRIAHLLRRAGFGATPAEMELYGGLGFDRAVERLLDYEQVPDDVEQRAAQHGYDLALPEDLRASWFFRLANTQRPLQEKMVLFWHGHFATAISKVQFTHLMWTQNELFRRHALGSFKALVMDVARDPAMLRWLDSNSNRKAHPNENFARELMELFTMGRGNYTEDDVKEAARAFTGWHFRPDLAEFVFNRNQHDFGPKTFLGRTGNWDGGDVVDIIMEQPATARWIAGRLFRYFVYDDPDEAIVERFATIFRDSGLQVKPLVAAILRSPEFLSERAFHARIKSPVELLIGAIKALGIKTDFRDIWQASRRTGQDLFNPPNVKGWDGGLVWISTSTMLERFNFANRFLSNRNDPSRAHFDPHALVNAPGLSSAEAVVDHLLRLLLDGDASPTVREALIAYLRSGPGGAQPIGSQPFVDEKVRGLLHLVLSTPTYQLA